jgi:putative chitinase
MLTDEQLAIIMPRCPKSKLTIYRENLVKAMEEASINTKLRIAAFLGQLALESGELRYFVEIADGTAYEGKKRLGNTQPGDGPRFKGRGPIQLTGRANYKAAGTALGVDLENNPERAADPDVAFRVAAWYWTSRKLNAKADAGDYRGITKSINGAATDEAPSHHLRRVVYYERALKVL